MNTGTSVLIGAGLTQVPAHFVMTMTEFGAVEVHGVFEHWREADEYAYQLRGQGGAYKNAQVGRTTIFQRRGVKNENQN